MTCFSIRIDSEKSEQSNLNQFQREKPLHRFIIQN